MRFRTAVFLALLLAGCDSGHAPLTAEQIAGARVQFVCGDMGFVDFGGEFDMPAYYYDVGTKKVISACGGTCMHRGEECEETCPPPNWKAEGCQAKFARAELQRQDARMFFLKDIPMDERHLCGKHAWVGLGMLAHDGPAAVYDLSSGELIAWCGGFPGGRAEPWAWRCDELMKEMMQCFPTS